MITPAVSGNFGFSAPAYLTTDMRSSQMPDAGSTASKHLKTVRRLSTSVPLHLLRAILAAGLATPLPEKLKNVELFAGQRRDDC